MTLGDCPKLIVSLLGHNVTGELRLSEDLAGPVEYGQVRIVRATDPVHVFLWALYSSGDRTDVTLRGPDGLRVGSPLKGRCRNRSQDGSRSWPKVEGRG